MPSRLSRVFAATSALGLAIFLAAGLSGCSTDPAAPAKGKAAACTAAWDCANGALCVQGQCQDKRASSLADAATLPDTAQAESEPDQSASETEAEDESAVLEPNDAAVLETAAKDTPDAGPGCKAKGAESCNGKDDNCDGKVDEGFADQDGDSIADCVDADVDGDGAPNAVDNCPKVANPDQDDKDFNGIGDGCDKDSDGDGMKDSQDNCPAVINQEQQDLDGDGLGDLCDPDMDGDTVLNAKDDCAKTYDPEQKDTDKDGIGNKCDDKDGDLVPWDQDNCPTVKNATQKDGDADGLGDACDPDMDNDGVANEKDNCVSVPNPNQQDTNEDGIGDACAGDSDGDGCPDKFDCKPLDATNGCDFNGKGPKELCDGKDNNCNNNADEGFGVGGECGLGVCSGGTVICGSKVKSICSTEIGGTNTKQLEKEKCNSLDDNCDGVIPQDEQDGDGDTFRVCDGDCDDDNPGVCPDKNLCPEKCDGLDDDCNGETDEGGVCTGLGEIIGYIYDATNPATALKGSKVELRDATCTTKLLEQVVALNGKFSFPSVNGPGGLYCLKVSLPGFEDQLAKNVQLGNQALGVPGYATVRQVDFGLKPFGYPFSYAGIAGKVWNNVGLEVKGAQVTIKASGNQIATDQTDTYANYTVVAMSPSTVDVTVLAVGFEPQTKTVTLKANETTVVDFKLLKAIPKFKCFADSFEWDVNPGWVVASSCGTPGLGKCPGWHRVDNTQTVKNAYAVAPNGGNASQPLVQIYGGVEILKAPDGTKHYWYGADVDGSFIGNVYKQGGFSGGHGSSNNGTLTSPPIDLQGFNKFTMTIQYWYEIESMNPKSYDVMQLQVSEAGKNSFTNVKQLNPTTDNYNAAKAYTSAGFATAPVWVTAAIDLSSFKGKQINIRVRFNTLDSAYNGYRGFGVDNVKFVCTP